MTARRPIYVVGAGGIGCFLASRLTCSDSGPHPSSVTLIARGNRLARLQEGIRITGSESGIAHPRVIAWEELESIPSDAFVIVASKAYQLDNILRQLQDRIRHTDPILALAQNGLGVLEKARTVFPQARLIRLVCWLGARFEPPATLVVGGVDRVELGAADVQDARLCQELAELLGTGRGAAGIPTRIGPDASTVEWRKALWNASGNGLCALAGASNGALLDDPGLRAQFEALLDETLAIARAAGVPLTPQDRANVLESHARVAANLNSTLQDLRAGRETEIDWLNGAVVRIADRICVPAPMNRLIHHVIHYLDAHRSQAKNTS